MKMSSDSDSDWYPESKVGKLIDGRWLATLELFPEGDFISELCRAAAEGWPDRIEDLFAREPDLDPDSFDWNYEAALSLAVAMGNNQCALLLIAKGADINFGQGGTYGTPLQAAAMTGNIKLLTLLLDMGADVDKGSFIYTPLQAAAACQQEEAIRLLLSRGASLDVNSVTGNDDTALSTACTYSSITLIRILVEAGADINLRVRNGHAATALCAAAAAQFDALAKVKVLIEYGANINTGDPKQLSDCDSNPITYAASSWHDPQCEVLRFLLENGADPESKDREGKTALIEAARRGRLEKVEVLLSFGADPNGEAIVGPHMTPLRAILESYVSVQTKLDIAKLLISKGADVNFHSGKLESPLLVALRTGKNELVQLLLDHGAEPMKSK